MSDFEAVCDALTRAENALEDTAPPDKPSGGREGMIDDDSPDVIGLCDHPMPTEDEFKAAFKAAYVARFVHFGIPEHVAVDCFEAADFSDLRDYLTPEDAADEEMSYWDDDGDES